MQSANFVTIMAILAEMTKCVNENIAKVRLTPIDNAFSAIDTGETGSLATEPSKG